GGRRRKEAAGTRNDHKPPVMLRREAGQDPEHGRPCNDFPRESQLRLNHFFNVNKMAMYWSLPTTGRSAHATSYTGEKVVDTWHPVFPTALLPGGDDYSEIE